ncbi:NAD-dependent succinate-semialdehyde dehydrogenase [Nevskia sp.]|uniref:NAD-dependent succinate-semialdehyde dehydrogenase n=1 Tax=Nevskia sp. TaxID=1929292 RepID=UPI0025EBFC55|nr:NAD-dependent succinate-semialdehyde dehydrogenase [Nevskia sp.]
MSLALKDRGLLRQQALIGGQWCGADASGTLTIRNPANAQVVGTVPVMGVAETRRAIAAAEKAQGAWKARSAKERSLILRRWFDLIVSNQEDLAAILTSEQGKPLTEARGEILYAASYVEWFAEEAKRVYGDVIPSHQPGQRIVVLRQPIGVCAAITPWNFPAAMITRKAAPALAVGCTMVFKPASQTPFTALALAELALRAGVPEGVFNVVTGSARDIGGEMTSNPVVRALSFTGSTEVGRELMRQSADTVKKLSLELGGNAPFIVFDDADLDAAVLGCIASKFRNAGQTCVCANRIYVQDGVYEAFSAKMVAAVAKLRTGDGFDSVDIGPMIDGPAVEKVQTHIADALAHGAQLLCGGKPHALGGNFFEPTVLSNATAEMLLAVEETFGPVAPLFRFRTEDEALALANATEFGLAAYFYGRDMGRVWRVAEGLECGIVGVNTGIISAEQAPFGGVKQSGIGREGSRYGLDEYVEIKYVCLGGLLPEVGR